MKRGHLPIAILNTLRVDVNTVCAHTSTIFPQVAVIAGQICTRCRKESVYIFIFTFLKFYGVIIKQSLNLNTLFIT